MTRPKPQTQPKTFEEVNATITAAAERYRRARDRLRESLSEVRDATKEEFDADRAVEATLKDAVLASFEASFTEAEQNIIRSLCEHHGMNRN